MPHQNRWTHLPPPPGLKLDWRFSTSASEQPKSLLFKILKPHPTASESKVLSNLHVNSPNDFLIPQVSLMEVTFQPYLEKKTELGITPSHFSLATCALHLGSRHLASHPIPHSPYLSSGAPYHKLSSVPNCSFKTWPYTYALILALISILT